MNDKKNSIFSIQTPILLIVITISIIFSRHSYTALNQNINATVKIGVCGNGIAEDNEDCEEDDLKDSTCISLGYSGGTLSCDNSCTYNTTLCTPVVEEEKDEDSDDSDSETRVRTITRVVTEIVYKYELPDFIKIFDINGDNKIDASEVYGSSKKWFDAWKLYLIQQVEALKEEKPETLGATSCDLNEDGECNLIDFSILMYYVDRE